MQYVNGVRKLCHVQDPEYSGSVVYPNLFDAWPHCGHRFSIVRLKSVLNLVKLKSGILASFS